MSGSPRHQPIQFAADQVVINRDSVQILKIFPEEIWLLIIGRITDPTTLENLSNASLYFRRLLYHNRVLFLFSKVNNICWQRDQEAEKRRDLEEINRRKALLGRHNDIAPNILYDVPIVASLQSSFRSKAHNPQWVSLIKNFRLVCYSWCQAIDQIYQNRDCNFNNKYDMPYHYAWDYGSYIKPNLGVKFSEQRYDILNHFLTEFGKTHKMGNLGRNPFLGRYVWFESRKEATIPYNVEIENFQRFCNEITFLIEKYGHHIWYCKLDVQDKFATRAEYYDKLREWLELMPNLRMLDLDYDFVPSDVDGQRRMNGIKILNATQIAELGVRVRDCRLPEMEHLKTLRMRNMPSPIFNHLALKHEQALCTSILGGSSRMVGYCKEYMS